MQLLFTWHPMVTSPALSVFPRRWDRESAQGLEGWVPSRLYG